MRFVEPTDNNDVVWRTFFYQMKLSERDNIFIQMEFQK